MNQDLRIPPGERVSEKYSAVETQNVHQYRKNAQECQHDEETLAERRNRQE
jgi:hypothetical protein